MSLLFEIGQLKYKNKQTRKLVPSRTVMIPITASLVISVGIRKTTLIPGKAVMVSDKATQIPHKVPLISVAVRLVSGLYNDVSPYII